MSNKIDKETAQSFLDDIEQSMSLTNDNPKQVFKEISIYLVFLSRNVLTINQTVQLEKLLNKIHKSIEEDI